MTNGREKRKTSGRKREERPKEAERRGRPVADRRPEVVEQKKEQKKNEKRMREDRVWEYERRQSYSWQKRLFAHIRRSSTECGTGTCTRVPAWYLSLSTSRGYRLPPTCTHSWAKPWAEQNLEQSKIEVLIVYNIKGCKKKNRAQAKKEEEKDLRGKLSRRICDFLFLFIIQYEGVNLISSC